MTEDEEALFGEHLRERYRKLLAPTPHSTTLGDHRVIVGEDLDEGDRVLIRRGIAKRTKLSPFTRPNPLGAAATPLPRRP